MQSYDKPLFFVFLGLTIFGLIMMSSMSIAGSFEVTGKNDFYFWRHFWHIVAGVPLFFLALKFPYEKLKQLAFPGFLLSVILLLLTITIGENYGTFAKLWLKIGPISFQPVELVKIAIIVFMSAFFSSGKMKPDDLSEGFLPFCFMFGIVAMMIIIQSDYGSLFVLAISVTVVYFVAGASITHLFAGFMTAVLGGTFIILANDYILHRIKVFLNPELDPLNTGFQMKQALIAIGSGGLFGRGFQNSIQKFDYLPEVQSDTIFAAISEEMGFFRILMLIGLYFFIAYRGYTIAEKCQDPFAKLLAVGLTTLIAGQAFINIAVNMALLPNTGITLPLISYGGSSLWASFIAFGLLLHISGQAKGPVRKAYTL